MWQWQEKRYLGAAHGLCGILAILLHLRSLVVALQCDDALKGAIDVCRPPLASLRVVTLYYS